MTISTPRRLMTIVAGGLFAVVGLTACTGNDAAKTPVAQSVSCDSSGNPVDAAGQPTTLPSVGTVEFTCSTGAPAIAADTLSATATPTPTDSASAEATPSPTSTDDACVTVPADPKVTITATLRLPASSEDASNQLTALRGSKLTGVIYAGEAATDTETIAWVQNAGCNGFTSVVDLDSLFIQNSLSLNQIAGEYVKSIDNTPHLEGYALSQGPADGDASTVITRLEHIRKFTDKPIYVGLELPSDTTSVGARAVKQFTAGVKGKLIHNIVYFDKSKWKTPRGYTAVGEIDTAVDHANALGTLQAYDAGKGLPTSDEVAGYAKKVNAAGVKAHYELYLEEPSADDNTYIRDCAEKVFAVVGN